MLCYCISNATAREGRNLTAPNKNKDIYGNTDHRQSKTDHETEHRTNKQQRQRGRTRNGNGTGEKVKSDELDWTTAAAILENPGEIFPCECYVWV